MGYYEFQSWKEINQCAIYLTYNVYLIWSLNALHMKRVVLYSKIYQDLFIFTQNQEKGVSINRFITISHVLSGGRGHPDCITCTCTTCRYGHFHQSRHLLTAQVLAAILKALKRYNKYHYHFVASIYIYIEKQQEQNT